MFLTEEIREGKDLYNGIRDERVAEILDFDEMEAVGVGEIAYRNLKNRLIEPRRPDLPSTVTFQRIHNHDKFDQWLESIADVVLFGPNTIVKVGFSFISWKPLTGEKIYIYAARPLAPFKFKFDTRKECLEEFAKIGKMRDAELLERTFLQNEEVSDPFSSSGYCPLKLVCSYIWITK